MPAAAGWAALRVCLTCGGCNAAVRLQGRPVADAAQGLATGL